MATVPSKFERAKIENPMRKILSLVRLGTLLVPAIFFGAERRPAGNPPPTASDPLAGGRVESSQGFIGPEGGTLVSPDGTVEVAWAPNPKRAPTASGVWTLVAGGGSGLSFRISGAPGPATISCFPPQETSPGTAGGSGPGPDPVKSPEPVIVIEEGNGEVREVEAPRQANGARKVRIDDDLAPIDVKGVAASLFVLEPKGAIMRLGETKTFFLRHREPPPPPPPESDPTSDDYLEPIAPTPPPGGDSSSDDYLHPLASKKAAGGSSAKAAPKASPTPADRAMDRKLGEMLRRTQQNLTKVDHWSVNDVREGNATVGTTDEGLAPLRGPVRESVEYTAPKKMPESIRGGSKSVRLVAHVIRGKKQGRYGVDVRLLDEGEVAVDFSCTLSHHFKESRSQTEDSIWTQDAVDHSESFTVTGSVVMKLSEGRGGGKGKESLYVQMENYAPIPLSYQAKLNRTKSHDYKGDGEYGKGGETVTEWAESSGTAYLPAPRFTYRRESKNWEVSIPASAWLREALQRSSPETHKVYRPERRKGPEHFAKLTGPWAIQNPPFDLPKFSDRATEADHELTGEIDRADGRVRYHVKWSVRR